MNILQNFVDSKLNKIIQAESCRNRAALKCLDKLGFPLPDIRNALIKANRIKVSKLADGHSIKSPTIYNTIYGKRANDTAKSVVSEALNLSVQELFPDEGSNAK